MKYSSLNHLFDFEFHDAELNLEHYEDSTLCVTAKYLNIHKNAKENPYDCDMEIKSARIHFKNIQIHSFEPMREYKIDDDGNRYTDSPQIIYDGDKAEELFISALKNIISINCIDIRRKKKKTFLEFSTSGRICFFATCSFSDVIIEWNEYCQKAWYELTKQRKYDISLDTPTGEQQANIYIVWHDEDVYQQGKLERVTNTNVGIIYNGNKIWGHSSDCYCIDAFAELQKQLPEDVKIKCCLTCRHGNFCPVGNQPNEVFCTKDVHILQKSDLFFYTEDENERKNRSREYAYVCEDFKEQDEDFYTYSDYLYELKKQ